MSHESIKSSCILCIQKAALRALNALKQNRNKLSNWISNCLRDWKWARLKNTKINKRRGRWRKSFLTKYNNLEQETTKYKKQACIRKLKNSKTVWVHLVWGPNSVSESLFYCTIKMHILNNHLSLQQKLKWCTVVSVYEGKICVQDIWR